MTVQSSLLGKMLRVLLKILALHVALERPNQVPIVQPMMSILLPCPTHIVSFASRPETETDAVDGLETTEESTSIEIFR